MFPSTSSRETLRFLGNKIYCSPRDQSLSVYCYTSHLRSTTVSLETYLSIHLYNHRLRAGSRWSANVCSIAASTKLSGEARRRESDTSSAPLHQTPSRWIALLFAACAHDSKVSLLAGYYKHCHTIPLQERGEWGYANPPIRVLFHQICHPSIFLFKSETKTTSGNRSAKVQR